MKGSPRWSNHKKTVIGKRMKPFTLHGTVGVWEDTRFINCYWPHLDAPKRLFSPGSHGLEVIGTHVPGNVIFPEDTQTPEYFPDALYPGDLAVKNDCWHLLDVIDVDAINIDKEYEAAFGPYLPNPHLPTKRQVREMIALNQRAIINLSAEETAVWLKAYWVAVDSFPHTHTRFRAVTNDFFLRHRQQVLRMRFRKGEVNIVGECDFYIARLAPVEAMALANGTLSLKKIKAAKTFFKIGGDDAEGFRFVGGQMVSARSEGIRLVA